jgi:hypothetical protein
MNIRCKYHSTWYQQYSFQQKSIRKARAVILHGFHRIVGLRIITTIAWRFLCSILRLHSLFNFKDQFIVMVHKPKFFIFSMQFLTNHVSWHAKLLITNKSIFVLLLLYILLFNNNIINIDMICRYRFTPLELS